VKNTKSTERRIYEHTKAKLNKLFKQSVSSIPLSQSVMDQGRLVSLIIFMIWYSSS